MKIAYCCVIQEPWIDVISEIESLGHKTSFIITWRDFIADFEKSGFSNLYTVEDCWVHKDLDTKCYSTSLEHDNHLSYAIKMYDRQDPFNRVPYAQRLRLYSCYIRYWETKLKNTDLIIFPQIPHRFFDYALYHAAERLKIKSIFFQITSMGSRVLPTERIDAMYMAHDYDDYSSPDAFDIDSFINRYRADYSKAKPEYLKRSERNSSIVGSVRLKYQKIKKAVTSGNYYKLWKPNSYYVYRVKNGEPNYIANWLEMAMFNLRKLSMLYKLRYLQNKCTSDVDLTKPYVFFALHYQPEETSLPSAGIFSDQNYVLSLLLDSLPDHVNIYVKEHGTQLSFANEGISSRDSGFYQRLTKKSDRVSMVNKNEMVYDLIDNSLFVVTLTGTVGLEAALRNKNALVFGRSWYEKISNVYKVNEKNSVTEAIENCLTNIPVRIESSDLRPFLRDSIAAVHYKPYTFNNDISLKLSKNNLTGFISQYVS